MDARGWPCVEHLHDRGLSPKGLTFKEPYGPDDEKTIIDRTRVRELAALNAERHKDLFAHLLSAGV
ncbi:hypothetical protein [Neorhizobium alkalisoli]|uniref:hypothetical protein n=1 Tax=Neorhizobium alkalisoli TaxID=528178 RepID=UPI00131A00F5|nr:hypothetical protein [Neorhizobium alkalisoli]